MKNVTRKTNLLPAKVPNSGNDVEPPQQKITIAQLPILGALENDPSMDVEQEVSPLERRELEQLRMPMEEFKSVHSQEVRDQQSPPAKKVTNPPPSEAIRTLPVEHLSYQESTHDRAEFLLANQIESHHLAVPAITPKQVIHA
jgi:hypothetical protein